jgi:transcriptional regulator with AAA-type ATPase domain
MWTFMWTSGSSPPHTANCARKSRRAAFVKTLYYRLNVLEIELPPLAERKKDIPTLSAFLLARLSPGRELSLGSDAARTLSDYNWPGNVRELRNALEHAATVCSDKTIRPHHLPSAIFRPLDAAGTPEAGMDRALQQWVSLTIVNPPPLLSAPFWQTNRFQMRLTGLAGLNYSVQVSINLQSSSWTLLYVTNNAATNSFLVVDPQATNKQRSYRILVGP